MILCDSVVHCVALHHNCNSIAIALHWICCELVLRDHSVLGCCLLIFEAKMIFSLLIPLQVLYAILRIVVEACTWWAGKAVQPLLGLAWPS